MLPIDKGHWMPCWAGDGFDLTDPSGQRALEVVGLESPLPSGPGVPAGLGSFQLQMQSLWIRTDNLFSGASVSVGSANLNGCSQGGAFGVTRAQCVDTRPSRMLVSSLLG